MSRTAGTLSLVMLVGCLVPAVARAQNDWQFPDPHFGIVEFGPGRPGPVTERQYREEIGPPGRFSAPGLRHRSSYPGGQRFRGARPQRQRGRLRAAH